MSQAKSVTIYGTMVELEGSYAGGGTMVGAEDGVELAEEFLAEIDYVNDGVRTPPPGSASANQRRGAPSGRFFTATMPTLLRGRGAAYSGSVFPEVHDLMRASGHAAALDATASAEKYTYTPEALSVAPASVFIEGYSRGFLFPFTGVYGSMAVIIDGPGYARGEFEIRGRAGVETDVSLPAITYGTTVHPKATGLAVVLGNFTAGVVRRVEFRQNRELADRANISGAAVYQGVANARMSPELVLVVEAAALTTSTPWSATSTFNPSKLYDDGIQHAISFGFGVAGAANYNRVAFAAAQAQLSQPPVHEEDGPTALWRLTYQLNPSTPILSDMYSWVWS